MRKLRSCSWLVAFIALGCATPEDFQTVTGAPGGACYPNATCNPGLACVADRCVEMTDGGLEAGLGGADAGGGGASAGAGGTAGAATGGSAGSTGGTGGGSGGASGGGASGGVGGVGGTGGTGGTGGASGGTGGTGGSTGAPPSPTNPQGCTTCGCCDPWLVSWDAVSGATHYNVLWKCSIFPGNVVNVGNVTQADLCATVGMCSSSQCANSVGFVQVEACNGSDCSTPVSIPTAGLPIACGGGCCC